MMKGYKYERRVKRGEEEKRVIIEKGSVDGGDYGGGDG